MASTFSSLKIELIGTGEQDGTWGDTTNTNLGTAIEQAITGSGDVTFTGADVTLTLANTNSAQVARNLRLVCVGTSGGARQLIVPAIEKQYIIKNELADTVTIKTSSGTGIAVLAGKTMTVFNDGTNVVDVTTQTTSLVTGSITASSPIAVASGGTGLATLTANNVILGNGTSNPSFVAPGNSANVLTSNGTTWVSSVVPQPEFFSSGTRMTFNQTSAPTGWTKDTSTNNAGFRLVSGSASSGGSVDFTTAFSATRAVTVTSMSGSAGATTLSTPQIPSHRHNVATGPGGNAPQRIFLYTSPGYGVFNSVDAGVNTGGGGSHTHPFSFSTGAGTVDLSVKYVDLIIAQKD
jgi:hypothetical protein